MYDWKQFQSGQFGFLNPQQPNEMQPGMQQQRIANMLRGQMGQSQTIGGGFGDIARGFAGGIAQNKANAAMAPMKSLYEPALSGFAASDFGQTPLGMGLGKLFGGFGK